MTTSCSNPWADKENIFNQELRNILSAAYVESDDNTRSSSCSRLARQITDESSNKKNHNLISRMRTADSIAASRRDSSLKVKLNMIQDEVKDVLGPDVITDMQAMFDTMSEKLTSLSDRNILQNITDDYNHKKNCQSLDVDPRNQPKLEKLLNFASNLRSGKMGEKNGLVNRENNHENRGKQVAEMKKFVDGGELSEVNSDNSIADKDIILKSVDALNTCDDMIQLGNALEDQFQKLNDFHVEFKTHILKFI